MSTSNTYPLEEVIKAEKEEIQKRRDLQNIESNSPVVGLAISGGGIRSATFSLGVIQSLAKHNILRWVDYLSTVSGGGYTGSFLSSSLNSKDAGLSDKDLPFAANGQDADPLAVEHLRNNSKYLAQGSFLDSIKIPILLIKGIFINHLFVMSWIVFLALLTKLLYGHFVWTKFVMGEIHWQWELYYLSKILLFSLLGLLVFSPMIYPFFKKSLARRNFFERSFALLISIFVVVFIFESIPSAILLFYSKLISHPHYSWFIISGTPLLFINTIAQSLTQFKYRLITYILGIVAPLLIFLIYFFITGNLIFYQPSSQSMFSEKVPCPELDAVLLKKSENEEIDNEKMGKILQQRGILAKSKSLKKIEKKDNENEWIIYDEDQQQIQMSYDDQSKGLRVITQQQSQTIPAQLKESGIEIPTMTINMLTKDLDKQILPDILQTIILKFVKLEFQTTTTIQNISFLPSDIPQHWIIDISLANKENKRYYLVQNKQILSIKSDDFIYSLETIDNQIYIYKTKHVYIALIGEPISYLGCIVLLIAIGVLLYSQTFVDVNDTSMHQFYRDRLSNAYLIEATKDNQIVSRDTLKLSQLNAEATKAPYHLINTTLNIPKTKQNNLQRRNSDFFVLSKRFCGSRTTGYVTTPELEKAEPYLNLGTAMAISGAAAAPNMGTLTIGYLTFFMTMFNIRLGYWIRNPKHTNMSWWKRVFTFDYHVGPLYWIRESVRWMSEETNYVNISDGGHIENLALYELLARQCKFIIAIDGEADPENQFPGLSTLIRFAKIDMRIDIDIDLSKLQKNESGFSKFHCAVGKIMYADGTRGHLLYIKSSLTGDENEDILGYRAASPSFPHESTADQFFSESQFESYRALGFHIGEELALRYNKQHGITRWFRELQNDLFSLQETEGRFIELQNELGKIEQLFLDPDLAIYENQIFPELTRTETVNIQDIAMEKLRKILVVCNMQLQLMENIFIALDFKSKRKFSHRSNRGWANWYRRISQASLFRFAWSLNIDMYGGEFQEFCEKELQLSRDFQYHKLSHQEVKDLSEDPAYKDLFKDTDEIGAIKVFVDAQPKFILGYTKYSAKNNQMFFLHNDVYERHKILTQETILPLLRQIFGNKLQFCKY